MLMMTGAAATIAEYASGCICRRAKIDEKQILL